MPELPEVETMVRGVQASVTGRRIESMEFCACTRKPLTVAPALSEFQPQVRGRTVMQVRRLAKRIIIELDREQAIVIEPRMTGLLLIADPPTVEHRRICWHFFPHKRQPLKLEFWDRRGLGTVSLMDQRQLEALTASLGIDALNMQQSDWTELLQESRREIKVFLLDQSRVAGIGNLYASEILHTAGILPTRPAVSIRPEQAERLHLAVQQILSDAIRYEGSTLGDGTYRNALNRDGTYQNHHRVYGRTGSKCLTCRRGLIRRIVQAQRATFFCPVCQR